MEGTRKEEMELWAPALKEGASATPGAHKSKKQAGFSGTPRMQNYSHRKKGYRKVQ